MKKENLIQEIGKPILMPLGFIQLFLFCMIALSPFIWIWKSWELVADFHHKSPIRSTNVQFSTKPAFLPNVC